MDIICGLPAHDDTEGMKVIRCIMYGEDFYSIVNEAVREIAKTNARIVEKMRKEILIIDAYGRIIHVDTLRKIVNLSHY